MTSKFKVETMEMPEICQRKPYPGSPNVQTNLAVDPRPNPIPPPQSSRKRLHIVQWIMLYILLLAITVGADKASKPLDIKLNDTERTSKKFKRAADAPINICETAKCKELDSEVQGKMDPKMSPCDDFYNHACGAFIKKTRIPAGKLKVTRLTKAVDRLQDEVSALIRNPNIRGSDTVPFRMVKYLYQQCMIPPEHDPVMYDLKMLGRWYLPEREGWVILEPEWWLVRSMEILRRQGYINDYFIRPSVEPDWQNTSRRMIYIDQPILGISRESLVRGMSDPKVAAYYNTMVNKTVRLGAEKERAKSDLLQSLNFEMQLASISLTYKRRLYASIMYNRTTIEDLQNDYPYMNWLDYFRVVFKDTGIEIYNDEIVTVKAPSYIKRLGPLIQATQNRTLINYVMWRVVKLSSFILEQNLQDQQQTQISAKEEEHRSSRCVQICMEHLPIAVASQYVKEHINGDSRRATLEMATELKNAFVDILKQADWMDKTARNTCLEKVNSMVFHIGYPDELLDARKVVDYYCDLERILLSSAANYLSAVLRIKQFNTMQNLKMLRKAVNKADWATHSTQAAFSVWYSNFENSVQMTTGLLQGLFLPRDLPRYMNYGTIGPIIGRYITQACDFQGREWDKNGSPKNWWQADTKNAYLDRRKCYIDQYDNYTEPISKIRLNGSNTADANIADHGGLKLAYYAYRKWAEKNGPERRLPSLKLSPERMFWVSAAQTMCSVYRPEELKKRITMTNKSPGQFRVVGAMGNLVEFSKDFNCPSGSPMNRAEKCKVW